VLLLPEVGRIFELLEHYKKAGVQLDVIAGCSIVHMLGAAFASGKLDD